jgi:diguanylate cyclase (GGDEF)-like protein
MRVLCSVHFAALLACFLLVSPAHADTPATQPQGKPLTKVSIQLKWFHQYQFAGFYAAVEKGFFREAGYDVELLEGSPKNDPVTEVVEGRADFGVGTSSLLVEYSRGAEIKVLSSYFQHSPYVLLARRDGSISTLNDLSGKAVMLESGAYEIEAMLRLANVHSLKKLPHTADIMSLSTSGNSIVDAESAYITTHPFAAAVLGIPFEIFRPEDFGLMFYGDSLFTSSSFVDSSEQVAIDIRNAVTRGWEYALKNPDELISLVKAKYAPQKTVAELSYEASAIESLFEYGVVEPGFMSLGRWEKISEDFMRAGLIETPPDIKQFVYLDNAPIANDVLNFIYGNLAVIALLMLGVSYVAYLNLRLKKLAFYDALTGAYSRALFVERLEQAISYAKRHQQKLGIVYLDVDKFKPINDMWGHHVGDEVLKHVVSKIKQTIRETDLVGRLGGDEFCVILFDVKSKKNALKVAQAIIDAVSNSIVIMGKPQVVTVSVGVSVYPDCGEHSAQALMKKADAAMYSVKDVGGDAFFCADQ